MRFIRDVKALAGAVILKSVNFGVHFAPSGAAGRDAYATGLKPVMNNRFLPLVTPGRRALALLALLIGLAACRAAPQETAEPALPLEPCRLAGGVEAQCGALTVFENRARGDGRTIDLNVAVIPAASSASAPDPLFMLAGGPGQSATETFPLLLGLFSDLNRTRDIVLVDQRGTGKSNPLVCASLEEAPLDLDLALAEQAALLQACAAELAATADLTQYTTDIAMADLDDVRAALGYERINLLGVSYGARAALAYARLFPERVRTLLLDAVAGPELVLFLQMPQDGQRALELLFARCAGDAACQTAFPDLRRDFNDLLARLETPQPITVADPLSGEPIALTLTRDLFSQLIFNTLYSADLAALLPLLVHTAAATGDFGPLVVQGLAVSAGAQITPGLLYTVTCAEDAPLIDLDEAAALQAGTVFALRADDFVEICSAWPRSEIAPDFRDLPVIEAPALLLSGEADPVTPPRYAEQAAARLPNSLHLVAPHYGHGVIGVGCLPRIAARFIQSGAVDGLETDCLESVPPPPFFVRFAGPEP